MRRLCVLAAAPALVLVAAAAASAPPVGPLPAGPTTSIHTRPGALVAVALPQRGKGLVWRLAHRVSPSVLVEVEEANVGRDVVVVYRATGAGHVKVAYGLTRGETKGARESLTFDVVSTAASRGFSSADGKVRCAVGVARQAGLLCAAAGVKTGQYDGRGVARLLPGGQVSTVPAGSDLLLAIDGNLDGTTRPALARGGSWRSGPFVCTNGAAAVRCSHSGHGFAISATSYARF